MKRTLITLTLGLTTLIASAQEVLKCDTINQNGKQMIRKTVKTIADGKKIVTDSLFSDGRFLTATQMNWFAYEGQPMPKFEVKTEDGETITSESLRGKTVVISFWISSCGPLPEGTQARRPGTHRPAAARRIRIPRNRLR